MIQIKRVYELSEKKDGYRILIDRLWPRGVSKEKANLDVWLKEIAPSDALRKWFSHDPKKWTEFERKYKEELKDKKQYLDQIKDAEKKSKIVTLLYAAKDTEHNNALVVKEFLK